MELSFNPTDLKPIVEAVVAEVLAKTALLHSERLAYVEAEAAALMGLKSHQLRDARLRGEITATKIGGRIGYSRNELLAYLARQQV